jgi:hypothetical protein
MADGQARESRVFRVLRRGAIQFHAPGAVRDGRWHNSLCGSVRDAPAYRLDYRDDQPVTCKGCLRCLRAQGASDG